jgi:hypothetical protein
VTLAYHHSYTTDPESVKALPNGEAWLASAKQMTFTGTREELRERLVQLEARGATGIIFGTSGYDAERELRAYAEVAGLK